MRSILGVLVLAGLFLTALGCDTAAKPGAATIPSGMIATPKDPPKPAGGGPAPPAAQ
jgi:hypothetical protein